MPHTVIVHIANEEAFLAEVDALPTPSDNVLVLRNFRARDGSPIRQVDQDAVTLAYPWSRVTYLEIMAERGSRDELIEFFRDED